MVTFGARVEKAVAPEAVQPAEPKKAVEKTAKKPVPKKQSKEK